MSGSGSAPSSLKKPELPKEPRATAHGRSNIGRGKEFADQAAFDAARRKHAADRQHYDQVLYPAYRAAKKRAVRPAHDGAQATQRRKDNPVAAANHLARQREASDLLRQARRLEAESGKQGEFMVRVCMDSRGKYPDDDVAMCKAVQHWAGGCGNTSCLQCKAQQLTALDADADVHPPDGTDEWWLEVQRVAHAAQTMLPSYNQFVRTVHPRCWRIDVAAVEEVWELRSDGQHAQSAQPLHKRENSTWTSASLQTRQQLVDAGFQLACKHERCCDRRDCWKYEDLPHYGWADPCPCLREYDAKGWPIAGARDRICRKLVNWRHPNVVSRTDGSRHRLDEAGQGVVAQSAVVASASASSNLRDGDCGDGDEYAEEDFDGGEYAEDYFDPYESHPDFDDSWLFGGAGSSSPPKPGDLDEYDDDTGWE